MSQGDTIKANERALRNYLDGMLAGDKAMVRRAFHEDVILRLPRPTMADKVVRGADNLTDFVVDLRNAAYDQIEAEYGVVVVDERGGVAEWRLQGSLKAGGDYDQFYCWVFKFADGLITDIHEYIDTAYGKNAVAAHASQSSAG